MWRPAAAHAKSERREASVLRDLPVMAPSARGIYLALGDSLAVGVGATRPAETGYVARLHRALARGDAGPGPGIGDLRNLAVSGETSRSMIEGGQLEAAVRTIEDADPAVALVTLDIGGNDLLALLRADACQLNPLAPACLSLLAETLDRYETYLRRVVDRLRDALDRHARDAELALMTYYNPFSGANEYFEGAADLALLGADGRIDPDGPPGEARGMNDIIAAVARDAEAVLVDVQPLFVGRGLQLTNIALYDVHANDRGYAAIADRFVQVLGGVRSLRP
jgi:lysophospholipase L1-like esterase